MSSSGRQAAGPFRSADRQHHAPRGAKLSVADAAVDEAGGGVEPQGVDVRGHFQSLRAPRPDDAGDAFDEGRGDPASHPSRVHEQVFQFEDVAGLGPGSEADQRSVFFRDMGAAFSQSAPSVCDSKWWIM